MNRLLTLQALAVILVACQAVSPEGQNFWIGFTGMIIMGVSAAVTIAFMDKVSPFIRKRVLGRAFCMARRSHDWINQHAKEDSGRLFSLEHIKCRTCWETMIWLEMLEVIKKIPRQTWMDPECSLCDHTNVIRSLARTRRWRPSMTVEVLTASFCRHCPKYINRMPVEAAITDEERPEPGVSQVHCPTCGRAFGRVGSGPATDVPECRHCHPGPPPMRVVRFRRPE